MPRWVLAGTSRSEQAVRRKGHWSEVQDNQPRLQIMLLTRSDEQYTSLKSAIINHFVIQVLFSFVLVTHKYFISIYIFYRLCFRELHVWFYRLSMSLVIGIKFYHYNFKEKKNIFLLITKNFLDLF